MTDNITARAAPSKTAQRFAAAVVFLFPVLILALSPADGLGPGLLALAGLGIAWQQRDEGQATREEKLLYFAVSFFFLAAVLVTLPGGIEGEAIKKLSKFAYLLLIIPTYIFLRHVGVNLATLWYGLAAGAIVAAGVAVYQVSGSLQYPHAKGVTNPIIFGDVALTMGCMTLAGAGWFKARAQWQMMFPVLAVVAGLLASVLSQSQGGWLAMPFLLIILCGYAWTRMARWQLITGSVVCCVLLVASYFIPETGVATRVDPLADQGIYSHNQFFSAMAHGGSLVFIALLLLFLVPAKLLFDMIHRRGAADAQRLALAGLLLIGAYTSFGFSEAILERVRPVSFFAFYLAVIFAAIQTQSHMARDKPVKRKQRLSVTIIAQDEADRIEPCLQSVANWADEIIVLDSGSSDNTVDIARRYTNKVFETDWPGYGPQKQRALEKADGDWVLSIDADERVSSELRYDIDAALTDNPECVGYCIPWAVIVYGHRMDFGRSARAPRRLFKREGARFTDAQVHEHVMLAPGKKGTLEGRLYHYTHRDYGHALQKSARYAWLGGQKRFAAGQWGGGLPVAALRSLWNFILIYFLRLGFLDGPVGFVVAVTYAQGAFNKYGALWALRRERKTGAGKGQVK